jgi:hypothetical protein
MFVDHLPAVGGRPERVHAERRDVEVLPDRQANAPVDLVSGLDSVERDDTVGLLSGSGHSLLLSARFF